MQAVFKELAGTLRHDELVPMNHITCNLTWLETFLLTMNYQENSLYRIQQLQFALANILTEIGKFSFQNLYLVDRRQSDTLNDAVQ